MNRFFSKKNILTILISVVIIFLSAAFIGLFVKSCVSQGQQNRINRVKEVAPEVNYGYQIIDLNYIMKNYDIFDYSDEAYKIIKNKNEIYPYDQIQTKDYMYFQYEYDRKGSVIRGERSLNNFTLDIALFRVDFNSCEFDLLYDFKNVYPTYNYTYTKQSVYSLYSDDILLFHYNGKLQVFDADKKEIISTYDNAYDHVKYRTCEFFPYGYVTNTNGDYAGIVDDKFYYFELLDNKYIYHKFDISTRTPYKYRYENYVYTAKSNGEPLECFDLTDNSRVDIEELQKILDEIPKEENPPEEYSDILEINSIQYKYKHDKSELVIKNYLDKPILTINHKFMLENQSFKELLTKYTNDSDSEYEIYRFFVQDSKLFVVLCNDYRLGTTPAYIFEIDLLNKKAFYVGFALDPYFNTFKIIET